MESRIQRMAWDLTVGCSNPNERPGEHDVRYVEIGLGRDITEQEKKEFREAWQKCHQEMTQP